MEGFAGLLILIMLLSLVWELHEGWIFKHLCTVFEMKAHGGEQKGATLQSLQCKYLMIHGRGKRTLG